MLSFNAVTLTLFHTDIILQIRRNQVIEDNKLQAVRFPQKSMEMNAKQVRSSKCDCGCDMQVEISQAASKAHVTSGSQHWRWHVMLPHSHCTCLRKSDITFVLAQPMRLWACQPLDWKNCMSDTGKHWIYSHDSTHLSKLLHFSSMDTFLVLKVFQ